MHYWSVSQIWRHVGNIRNRLTIWWTLKLFKFSSETNEKMNNFEAHQDRDKPVSQEIDSKKREFHSFLTFEKVTKAFDQTVSFRSKTFKAKRNWEKMWNMFYSCLVNYIQKCLENPELKFLRCGIVKWNWVGRVEKMSSGKW